MSEQLAAVRTIRDEIDRKYAAMSDMNARERERRVAAARKP
jgi:hypothetical protein